MGSSLDPELYLKRCCVLLTKWSWLYRERATHILVSGLLDTDPVQSILQHMKSLDKQLLTKIPQGYCEEEWPEDLKYFIKECFDLGLDMPLFEAEDSIQLTTDFYRGMSPKKKEEVTKLGALVAHACRQAGVTVVVDVGSGLGYIDRLLSRQYSLSVIGLERDLAKVRTAQDYGGEVEYLRAELREDNLAEITSLVEGRLGGRPASIICLHACGDLSIRTETIFTRLDSVRCMVNVPCCYHLGSHYPVSVSLKESGVVTPNLLRLASESSADRWCLATPHHHTSHAMALLARAALECFAQNAWMSSEWVIEIPGAVSSKFDLELELLDHFKVENEGVRVEKTRRRLMRGGKRSRSWEECLEEVKSGLGAGLDKGRLSQMWAGWGSRLPELEAYLCLQTSLQGLAEGLLLVDRLRHLINSGLTESRLIRVFKPHLSPRSLAILAFKKDPT